MISHSKILVVDDEPYVCSSIAVLLEENALQVKTATSAVRAMEIAADHTFDLFLIDKQMPETDGFQLMAHVLDRFPGVPVIIMTGEATIDSAILSLRMGAYDYLRKPFNYEDLVNSVKNALTQKKLREENTQIISRLELAEKKYRDLIQNSPDVIFTLDQCNCFLFVNMTFERLFGFSPDRIRGTSFFELIPPDDQTRVKWFINDRRIQKQGAPSKGIEVQIMCAPDSMGRRDTIAMELKKNDDALSSAVYGENQNKDLSIVARDIRYRISFEQQLIQTQKMEAIGTMAGGIVHDFNNLLMSIQSHTSLLKCDIGPENPLHEKLLSIEKHIQSGSALTRQLMNFARGNQSEVCRENLNDLIKTTVKMFYPTKKNITIHYELEKDIWPVTVNAGQIEQVLLNLFVNAHQAMPMGGDLFIRTENLFLDRKRLEDDLRKSGNYVKVTIRDTGSGIPLDIQNRIFDPFFTTKKPGEGNGLGLASAFGIIKQHRGALHLESSPGNGASFIIFLASSVQPPPREEKPATLAPDSAKKTIMVINHDSRAIDSASQILTSLGYGVMAACSGAEGVSLYMANEKTIDAIIMDVAMPGINSRDTLNYILQLNPRARVILTLGCTSPGEAEALIKQGCVGYLSWPFTREEVSLKLTLALTDSRES
ncbi:MAG: response regulator [Pseudomonadota bacterium]